MSYIPEGPRRDLVKRLIFVTEEERPLIRSKIASAEFRSLLSRNAQIRYLRQQPDAISLHNLTILFSLSKSTISDVVHGRQPWEDGLRSDPITPPPFSGNRQILSHEEECLLLEWIQTEQNAGNCATPRDVRVYAQSLYENRTGEETTCTIDWWKSFKRRHKDEIETRRCLPMESGRVAVAAEDVLLYFARLREVIQQLKTPAQLLNMDETGNSSRPNKGRSLRVVCSKRSTVEAHYQEAKDVTHVSLAGTVALSGKSLKPFLLTISSVRFRDPELAMLQREFATFQTQKGYMTTAAMEVYLRDVIEPYAVKLRRKQGDPTIPIYLIMDNHDSHNRACVLQQMASVNIVPIWLPPHSSHFLQVLDVGVFGAYKTNYRNARTKATKPKLEGKLLRVLKAWHTTTWTITIWNAWRASGMQVTTIGQVTFHVSLNWQTIRELVEQHCADGQAYLASHPIAG